MAKLPVVSGAEAVKAFQRGGWRIDRQRGSHVVLLKAGHIASLSVPHAVTRDGGSPPPALAEAACVELRLRLSETLRSTQPTPPSDGPLPSR